MPLILGIESTCDETAAALVVDGRRVLSNVVATQFELHAKFRGVVPEIACRAHIENILPVITQSLADAGHTLADLDAIAVAHRPGLIGSLLIGVTAAKTLAYLLHKPLVAVDHVQAHLYSVLLDQEPVPPFPAAGAVLSGGHTALYRINAWTDITRLGGTIDDAIGEAYDKVAAILGLGFPGGPALAKLADAGDPHAIKFPQSLFERDSLDMSLSGLKTAVLYNALGAKGKARTHDALSQAQKADIAASFQHAVISVLEEKLRRLIRHTGAKSVILGGGVVSNQQLRTRLAASLPVPLFIPHRRYCTDNAAMSAGLADVLLSQGLTSELSLDAITHSAIATV